MVAPELVEEPLVSEPLVSEPLVLDPVEADPVDAEPWLDVELVAEEPHPDRNMRTANAASMSTARRTLLFRFMGRVPP